jgi:hypothetical protein
VATQAQDFGWARGLGLWRGFFGASSRRQALSALPLLPLQASLRFLGCLRISLRIRRPWRQSTGGRAASRQASFFRADACRLQDFQGGAGWASQRSGVARVGAVRVGRHAGDCRLSRAAARRAISISRCFKYGILAGLPKKLAE